MADSELTDQAPGMVFPCTIGIKIFIANSPAEEALIQDFVNQHIAENVLLDWTSRESSGGKYLAITATVNAQSRQHIDAFYQLLSDHKRVIMLI